MFTPWRPIKFENMWSHDGKRPLLAGFYPFPLKKPGVKSVTKFSKCFFLHVFRKPTSTFSSRTFPIFQIFMKLRRSKIDASIFTLNFGLNLGWNVRRAANIEQLKIKTWYLRIALPRFQKFRCVGLVWSRNEDKVCGSFYEECKSKLTEGSHKCLSIHSPFV